MWNEPKKKLPKSVDKTKQRKRKKKRNISLLLGGYTIWPLVFVKRKTSSVSDMDRESEINYNRNDTGKKRLKKKNRKQRNKIEKCQTVEWELKMELTLIAWCVCWTTFEYVCVGASWIGFCSLLFIPFSLSLSISIFSILFGALLKRCLHSTG